MLEPASQIGDYNYLRIIIKMKKIRLVYASLR